MKVKRTYTRTTAQRRMHHRRFPQTSPSNQSCLALLLFLPDLLVRYFTRSQRICLPLLLLLFLKLLLQRVLVNLFGSCCSLLSALLLSLTGSL
jgi:hypothetical protein